MFEPDNLAWANTAMLRMSHWVDIPLGDVEDGKLLFTADANHPFSRSRLFKTGDLQLRPMESQNQMLIKPLLTRVLCYSLVILKWTELLVQRMKIEMRPTVMILKKVFWQQITL